MPPYRSPECPARVSSCVASECSGAATIKIKGRCSGPCSCFCLELLQWRLLEWILALFCSSLIPLVATRKRTGLAENTALFSEPGRRRSMVFWGLGVFVSVMSRARQCSIPHYTPAPGKAKPSSASSFRERPHAVLPSWATPSGC